MILGFSTMKNGNHTFFVEKIHKGLTTYKNNLYGLDPSIHYPSEYNFYIKDRCAPKLHTLREDPKDRWKAGVMIDFFINVRQPGMFRFAPKIEVVSTQRVEIIRTSDYLEETIVRIDGRQLNELEARQFAFNDGFESLIEFWLWFKDGFDGKLIHWTDFRY